MFSQTILIGNLGGDPEVRSTQSGEQVASFSIATTENWKADGERKERTEWHRCVAWGNLAGVLQKYCRKGDKLMVSGQMRTRKWTDQKGEERFTTELNVRELKMLGSKRDGQKPDTPAGRDDFDDEVPF